MLIKHKYSVVSAVYSPEENLTVVTMISDTFPPKLQYYQRLWLPGNVEAENPPRRMYEVVVQDG
jgi:hypothetical protein